MGTPYEIDTEGRILFIEDVGEEPYRMDRMLNQLRMAGKFDMASAVIIGKCAGCNGGGLEPSRSWDYSLGEVIDQVFEGYDKPVIYGVSLGHTGDQMCLPMGAMSEMRTNDFMLKIYRK